MPLSVVATISGKASDDGKADVVHSHWSSAEALVAWYKSCQSSTRSILARSRVMSGTVLNCETLNTASPSFWTGVADVRF